MGTGAVHKPAYLANNLAGINSCSFFFGFLSGTSYMIGSWPGLTEHTLTAFFFFVCIVFYLWCLHFFPASDTIIRHGLPDTVFAPHLIVFGSC